MFGLNIIDVIIILFILSYGIVGLKRGVIKELVMIIVRLGIASGVPGLSEDIEINIDFDDSIIEDKAAERQSDRNDVAMGVMGLDEYRSKYYGETIEEARKNLPEQNTVME